MINEVNDRLNSRNPVPFPESNRVMAAYDVSGELDVMHIGRIDGKISDEAKHSILEQEKNAWQQSSLINLAKYEERLDYQRAVASHAEETLSEVARAFNQISMQRVESEKLSAGRAFNLKKAVGNFCHFAGGERDIKEVSESLVRGYYAYLQSLVKENSYKSVTARDYANNVGRFLRWAWREHYIESIPRNLGQHELVSQLNRIEVYTKLEIGILLNNATQR